MKALAVVEKAYRGLTATGGAETMLADMLEYLVSQGWEVEVLILNGGESRVLVNGVRVIRTQDKSLPHELAKSSDLIITHLGGTPRARMLGKAYGVPVVQVIHNTNEYTIGFLGDGCDYAVYNADWTAEFHESQAQTPVIKCWTGTGTNYLRVRSCFAWNSMVLRPPVVDPPKDMADPDGYITLVNLVENKGVHIMYELADRNPDWKFMGVIGGYSPDSQVIRDVRNVKIHEHVQDVDLFYSQTSILIVPSRYESYGRVAVEAMGRGIPVIVSETPGLVECVADAAQIVQDRDNPRSWEAGIEEVKRNYSVWQDRARKRHEELSEQSRAELELFADEMERLVNGAKRQ